MTTKKDTKQVEKAYPKGTTTFTIDGLEMTLKAPDRAVYERVIPLITPMLGGSVEMIKAGAIILRSCWIDGDEDVKNEKVDASTYTSFCIQAVSLIEIKEAEIKKN